MRIDTEIGHVTEVGANLFLEMGLSAAEAKKLHAASPKRIDDTRALKLQLMAGLSNWISQHQLKQAHAAPIPIVSRPRGCDVVNNKTAKLTLDALVERLRGQAREVGDRLIWCVERQARLQRSGPVKA